MACLICPAPGTLAVKAINREAAIAGERPLRRLIPSTGVKRVMDAIAAHPYYKVKRAIIDGEQRVEQEARTILLYEEKVSSCCRTFLLDDVYDMSYRTVGSEGGILYLHTHIGVFPYTVKADPAPFIDAFKAASVRKKE